MTEVQNKLKEQSAGEAILAFLLFVPSAIFESWVAQKLWLWFASPTFHVKVPNIPTIYGLMILIAVMWSQPEKNKTMLEIVATQFVFSVIALAFGYVAYQFAV